MLEAIIKHLKRDKRGISNVIVVMLSLVLVVVIVANVVLWSYQMNQLDWEKMNEDISIANVTSIREIWSYNPSGYALGGSTSNVSGSISDLTSDDGVYMTFRSAGNDTSDFVDQTCDLYPPSAKGTHSNFAAQKDGPDSIYDTLTEEGFPSTDSGPKYAVTGSTSEITGAPDQTYATVSKSAACEVTDYEAGTSVIKQVYFNITYYGTVSGTLAWAYQLDGGDWNKIEDLPEGGSALSPLTRMYNATNLRGSWTWNNLNTTDIQFQNNDAASPENAYVDAIYVTVAAETYMIDLEVQWTSADYDKTNEELCIKTGTFSGSEDLQVKVRSGGSWVWIMNLTANQWNNMSVTSYLTGSTFTIQFLGGTETSDTTQNSWSIDVTLLHVWSDEYTMEVEFTGSSNTENWTQLDWTIDSAWTIGLVNVTLQLYNYTLDNYPTSGNGYISYTSNATANADETKNQTIPVNPTHFRNTTGYWKMKVKGVKATDTQFDFKADWIEFKPVKAAGTLFNFENEGSLTCHLVSLWIINSTVHQHYDINTFINSGDTTSYTRSDISLPNEPYTVKVVTERGNTAVFASQ